MLSIEKRLYKKEYMRKWRETNHLRKQEINHKSHIKRYGLTPEAYQELLTKQNLGCAICGRENNGYKGKVKLNVDHCHLTGKVRGLLCNKCNSGLGCFEDKPNLLLKACVYVSK